MLGCKILLTRMRNSRVAEVDGVEGKTKVAPEINEHENSLTTIILYKHTSEISSRWIQKIWTMPQHGGARFGGVYG